MNNAVFLDVTPHESCKNRCFGGFYFLHHQGEENQRARKKFVVTSKWNILRRCLQGQHSVTCQKTAFFIDLSRFSFQESFVPGTVQRLQSALLVL
jgi:hypothetical protein